MTNSTRSFVRFAKHGALALTLTAVALTTRPEKARACASDFEDYIETTTTFDPSIAGEVDGLYYDPYHAGFGGPCDGCAKASALEDWTKFLGDGITPELWSTVLYDATSTDLAAISTSLATKRSAAMPAAYVALLARPAAQTRKLVAALGVVKLARQIETYSVNAEYGDKKQPAPTSVLDAARTGATTKDTFLAQRYAFLGLRATFYQRHPDAVIAYAKRYARALAGPSQDLAWRARYYNAGALIHTGQRPLGNLELARIHAGSEALAPVAAQDFAPREEADWRASLALARSAADKIKLWRLVGLKLDGVVAIEEIRKLDPKSNTIPLLLVRELAKLESSTFDARTSGSPARNLALGALERLANDLITSGGDRRWLLELVSGHLAALRGDLTAARAHLARALAAKPTDLRVAQQAKASLALGLVAAWKLTPAFETELASTMSSLDEKFPRYEPVTTQVHQDLARAYFRAGKLADAELLYAGTVDAGATGKLHWTDPKFIQSMIARVQITTAPFDKFVVGKAITRAALEDELAWRYVLDGNLPGANKLYAAKPTSSTTLGTDPFVTHIVDCHDCDHVTYSASTWTHQSLIAKLAELAPKTKTVGDNSAKAALALGNAYYNLTWYGNARAVLESTHQATNRPTAALGWYAKAHSIAKSRELKAKAAYLAAKAELGLAISDSQGNSSYNFMAQLPVPATWFPILARYADTAYYKEVLAECDHFARWARSH